MLNRYFNNSAGIVKLKLVSLLMMIGSISSQAQISWVNQNTVFELSTDDVQIFKSFGSMDGSPFIAYYVSVDVKYFKKKMLVDTTAGRRLTPSAFYQKNNSPLIVMNCSFFEFKQNRNVNLIVKNGKMVAFDTMPVSRKGKDTLTYAHHFGSAFGWTKNGKMDIVYNFNDSTLHYPLCSQVVINPIIDSTPKMGSTNPHFSMMKVWKPEFAFGGGPSLLKDGKISITNNEERKFAGKAIDDKHPRTAIGYTKDGKMILLAVQGRMKNIADGATLPQLAKILMDLGCIEGMNLDGGGSSCLLINGKETIKPSDPEGQRPIPAVLVIK